jgi:hypothetical protein
MKFGIWVLFEYLSRNIQFSLRRDNNKRYFTWRPKYNFYHISLISSYNEKIFRQICRENRNTHFRFNNFFFQNRAVYEIMWKNVIQPSRPQMTIGRMRIACWIPKASNTHSCFVILVIFSLQQWLNYRALILRYTYIKYCCVLCLFRVVRRRLNFMCGRFGTLCSIFIGRVKEKNNLMRSFSNNQTFLAVSFP